METVRHHAHTSEKIDNIPTSTPEEIALGRAIVAEEFGSDFWLTIDLPRHVGVKGDARVFGETVLIETDNPLAARQHYADDGNLERISNRITNEMSAVVKVLFDIFGQGQRSES